MPWEQNQRETPSDNTLRCNCFYYIFYSKAEYDGGEKQWLIWAQDPCTWIYLAVFAAWFKEGFWKHSPCCGATLQICQWRILKKWQSLCLDKIPVNKHIHSLKGIQKVLAMSFSIIQNDFV